MIFETIHSILNGSLQPWRKDNTLSESIYRERLMSICANEMREKLTYKINYRPELLFTYRLKYYCRIILHDIASHLHDMLLKLSQDDCYDLTYYHMKVTREAITTLVHDAVKRSQQFLADISSLSQPNSDFLTQRDEKEYTVILRFIVASLCLCRMEIQQRYRNAINPVDIYDVPTFYASVAGWSTDPLFEVVSIATDHQPKNTSKETRQSRKQPKKKSPNTFTKATFILSGIQEDAKIAESRWSVSCESLFADFVKADNKANERLKIEKLFTGRGLNANEKIVWKAAKKELVYFFRQLKPHLTCPTQEYFWNVVASHFIINTEGKRKTREVAISADSLQQTSEKPQPDMVKKLDEIIKLLTAPIGEVLRVHSADIEDEPDKAHFQQMVEQDFVRDLNSSKQKR